MPGTSAEDYLKAIFKLGHEQQPVTTKNISEHLGVRMASVTGMIKQLAANGYVEHQPYYGVRLTESGKREALRMLRRHRLIELFLVKTLDLGWDEVDEDAEQLEHGISDRLVERIAAFLGHPQFDPHGSPIPSPDGEIGTVSGVTLDQLDVGSAGDVINVSDEDPEFLRYLTKLAVKIGSRVRVLDRAPFAGPISINVARKTVTIGVEAAKRITVSEVP